MKCAVRNVEKAKLRYGDAYEFVALDFSGPSTFETALNQINKIFLIYPPGDQIEFESFLQKAKEKKVEHIVYLSVKDVQFLPFIHHFKNEKLLKKLEVPYTFIRAGYFMQNLNDFLGDEIKERHRIFIPAGNGKTSFVDTRDLAEVASIALQHTHKHQNKKYVITGEEALDFYHEYEQITNKAPTKLKTYIKDYKEKWI